MLEIFSLSVRFSSQLIYNRADERGPTSAKKPTCYSKLTKATNIFHSPSRLNDKQEVSTSDNSRPLRLYCL